MATMNDHLPQLPTTQEAWDDLLRQLRCGVGAERVCISSEKSHLQLRILMDSYRRVRAGYELDHYLTIAIGLHRPTPLSPCIQQVPEFFDLGGQRIMFCFDPWEARHDSGVPLLQKAINDIARSVIKNAILDLACDVDNWRDSVLSKDFSDA